MASSTSGLSNLPASDQDFINSIVSKAAGDTILKAWEVQVEILKEGTVFKKAKREMSPRILVLTQHRLCLFDSSAKVLKEKRVVDMFYLDLVSVEFGEGNKSMTIKQRIQRSVNELEIYHDSCVQIASTMRQCRHQLVPEWPELPLAGQPSAFSMPSDGFTTFETFKTTYASLCVHQGVPPSESILHFASNLYHQGEHDFNVSQIPGIESNGSSEGKDPLYAQLSPLLLALKFDRFFLGFIAHGVMRKELVPLLAQVIRYNYNLTKLQISNTDADANALLDLSIAMKENRSLRLQIIEVSDHKSMDHRFVTVIASTLSTYPIPRLTHLNLGKSGIPSKGLTKLFQAFTMNYSISLGISHLNLSGSKFDSDTVAALELWLELGGNYSHLEELVLSNISGFPFKPLPKFKACTKLQRLDISDNKLDSSSDLKSLALLLTESPSLRQLDFSNCGIERSSIFDTIIASIKKMKSDSIEINLSNNTAPASDSKWVAALQGVRLKSISLNGIHFKESYLDELITGFQKFPALQSFSICDCKTKPKNVESLATFALFPSLRTLSLSNSFESISITTLIRELTEKNRSITNLDISCNLLGDESAMAIIKLVGQTSVLKRLNCDGNSLSFSAWQGIYQAIKNNPTIGSMQYPHGDMMGLMSWASTALSRHSAVITQVLALHDLLRTVSVDSEKDPRGSLTPVEPKVDVRETPLDTAPAAPIPSHLASQHSEMKLEDLAEWTAATSLNGDAMSDSGSGGVGSLASGSASGSQSSTTPRPTSIRQQPSTGSLRRPSVADVFNQQHTSSAPSSPASGSPQPPSPRSHSVSVVPSGVPGGIGSSNVGSPSPLSPRIPLPALPNGGPPGRTSSLGGIARPMHPGKVPLLHSSGGSNPSSSGPPGALPPPLPNRGPSGSLSISPRDEFSINPMSNISFGSYGQCDEEIDPDEPVRQATINEMVIRLAHEATSDVKFMHTFLLTYRATVEPVELLDRLISRFFSKPPSNSRDEIKSWAEQTLKPIRLRIMNVLKRWCEAHWQDFANDAALIATIEQFLKDGAVLKNHESAASSLLSHIQKQVSNSSHKAVMSATLRSRFDPEKVASAGSGSGSGSSSDGGVIGLLAQYSPEEIAEQMCLLESDLFGSLQIKEFFNQGWNKGSNEQKDLAAPNIRLMIKVSNQIITWIAFEILRQPSASARSKAIGKAIQLAILLNEKNNFNGVKEITAGLCLSSIQRLKKAWSTVKPKFKQAYNDLCDKVANMQSLRNLPHSVNPPLVPYLGVYLTDLVFIEDGNPNTFEEDGSTFINFRKMSIMGEVLMEISSYQQERYCFLKIDDLYNYLLMMEAHSDNELHQLSQTAEPKKR